MSLWDLIRAGRSAYRRARRNEMSVAPSVNYAIDAADQLAREQEEAREWEERRVRAAADMEAACLRNGGAWFPED